jgi:hypothetical protein
METQQAVTHKGLLVIARATDATEDHLLERAWFVAKNMNDLKIRQGLASYATMWAYRAVMGCGYDRKINGVLDRYAERARFERP